MSERDTSMNRDDHDPSTGSSPVPLERAMTSTNALTAIAGTNGYQQQVPIDRGQPLHLSVSNASGQVRISGSDQEGIWVVVRRSDGQSTEDPIEIPVSVDIDGNNVSIHPDWGVAGGFAGLAKKIKDQLQHGLNPSDWDLSNFRLNPDLNYDIRVEIPRDLVAESKVTAKTASGSLTISDIASDVSAVTASGRIEANALRGNVSMNSASGSVRLEEIDGSLEVNAVSGGVDVSRANGWTSLRTVSGRIQLSEGLLKHARVATVSGSVKAAFTAINAQTYAFSTVSGSVKLDVTAPASVISTLTSKSASGSAQADGEWTSAGRRSWSMGTGQTGPALDVKTVSGSLKCTGRTDPTIAAQHEPLPELQLARDAASAASTHDARGDESEYEQKLRQNAPPEGFDLDVDGITAWAKDFARDLKKNFASLATPPEPNGPEAARPAQAPVPPMPPTPPAAPPKPASVNADQTTANMDEATARVEEQVARAEAAAAQAEEHGTTPAAGEPWTWSSGSGATPPSPARSAGETAPIEPEPANTVDTAEAAGTISPADAERLRVLEALERGDIDIDEALSKLDPDDAKES